MRVKAIADILREVSALPAKQDRVRALQGARDNTTLLAVLQAAFDPRCRFLLPSGTPPYKPNDQLDQEGQLYSDVRKLYLFIEGGHPTLGQPKREMLFIQFLESLHPMDAKMMVAVKDKKMPFKGVTRDVVEEAFPDLFPREAPGGQV